MTEGGLQEQPDQFRLARIGQENARNEEFLSVSAENSPQLTDYIHIIIKYRWTVLLIFLVILATVAIGTFKEKPLYKGQALIEIDPEQPDVVNFREVFQLASGNMDTYLETQYRVLQSRTLAENVVNDLQLYRYPEFYRNRMLFGLIQSNPKQIPSPSDPRPPNPSSQAYRNSVDHFLSTVDVSPVRRSNLVDVSFYSDDPKLAEEITNRLAEDYINENLKVKWDETMKASDWLQTQLVTLKARLEKSEDALQTYAKANSIIFVDESKNLTSARLEQIQNEYTSAQADRYQKEALYSLVNKGKVQDLPGILQNKLIQDLSEQLATLREQYSEMTSIVKPDYPKAVALKKQINTIQTLLNREKKALIANIVDEYKSAEAREKYLQGALQDQRKVFNDIAAKTIQYNILKRDVDTNKSLYDGLLQRLKEANVSAGLRASNILVVDPAQVPKHPAKPHVLLNLLLGAFFGLGIGVGIAFLLDYLDNTLKTPDEVEQLLRLPSLGVLPRFALNGAHNAKSAANPLLVDGNGHGTSILPRIHNDPASSEAFRSLRTSVLLSAVPVPRVILVTSALPSEGKTTTLVNLAATLASLGSKVLIVDCDLRRPACHRALGVDNRPGFVQCLTGRVTLSEAILPVRDVPNLSVIPSGPIPPNPAEILSSSVAKDLITNLRNEFEYVLVDSPPILSVSDGRILATLTDAVVLVTRANDTPFDVVRRARSLLYGVGARILGVALNDVNFSDASLPYSYYHRYGTYGYVYGEDADGKM